MKENGIEDKLKSFLYDEKLIELDNNKAQINIFNILKTKKQELKHSNFLAWLFDPNGNHRLGSSIVERLLMCFLKENDNYNNVDVFYLLKCDFSDLIVYRELNNIDILLVSNKSKLVVAIENKVVIKEHDNQLQKYKKYVQSKYSQYKQIYIYLTPDKTESSDPECWRSMSYSDLYEIISYVKDSYEMEDREKIYIEDYLEVLRGEFMENEALRKKCENIYLKHKDAIDLIINYIPDEYYERSRKLSEALKKYKDKIEIITDSTTYIRFVSKKIKTLVPSTNNEYWLSTGDFIVYEIKNKRNDNCVLQLLIGPAEEEIRRQCYNLVQPHFKKTKKYYSRFNQIDAKVLAKKVDKNGDFPDNDDAVKALCNYMERDFDKNDEFFEAHAAEIDKWTVNN